MLSGLPSLCFRFFHPTSHFPQSQARMSVSSSGHHTTHTLISFPPTQKINFSSPFIFTFLSFHKNIKPLLFRDPPPTFSSQLIGLGSASPLPWAHVDVPFPQDRSSQAVRKSNQLLPPKNSRTPATTTQNHTHLLPSGILKIRSRTTFPWSQTSLTPLFFNRSRS